MWNYNAITISIIIHEMSIFPAMSALYLNGLINRKVSSMPGINTTELVSCTSLDKNKIYINNTHECKNRKETISRYSQIKTRVLSRVQDILSATYEPKDEDVIRVIEETIINDRDSQKLTVSDKKRMRRELFNRIRRMDVLTDLLEDDSITEIMVNGISEIYVEREGRIVGSGYRFDDRDRLFDIILRIASGVNRSINIMSPILDARLSDGSRVNIVLDPVALNGPILTIRKFPKTPVDATRLIQLGSITREVLDFVAKLVRAKYNILISGGTGSGKTTFLNICSGFIPPDERIITIEDSAELRIMNVDNLVRLETRNATADGLNEITIRDLIKSALRMRPDRVIVGEVRGEEAIDMLQAFSVGQDGSLSTIHANHAEDALYRLETMIMLSTQIPLEALRRQIATGVDIIIQLGRLRDRSRHLLEIREVVGISDKEIITSSLYEYVETDIIDGRIIGDIVKRNELKRIDKMQRAGIAVEL